MKKSYMDEIKWIGVDIADIPRVELILLGLIFGKNVFKMPLHQRFTTDDRRWVVRERSPRYGESYWY